MLRLWPEKLVVGLFSGHCWLQRGGAKPVCAVSPDCGASPEALLAMLGTLLEQHETKSSRPTTVSLIISDNLGALVALPWQQQLSGTDEVRAYAGACFEQVGIDIGDTWAMHARFRHHGGMGLAHAVPRAWLAQLHALLAAHGCQLGWVLPVSAMAYWHHKRASKAGIELLLLREARRNSILVYDKSGLLALDAEVVTIDPAESAQRLLRRISAYYPDAKTLWDWCAWPREASQPLFLQACLPQARVRALGPGEWR